MIAGAITHSPLDLRSQHAAVAGTELCIQGNTITRRLVGPPLRSAEVPQQKSALGRLRCERAPTLDRMPL